MRYFILLVTTCISFISVGQTSIVLDGTEQRVTGGKLVTYWEDTGSSAKLTDVLNPVVQADFRSSDKDILAFGLSASAYWIKIPVRYVGLGKQKSWVLELTLASYSEVSFFEHTGDEWHETKTGTLLPYHQRPIQYRFFAFPIQANQANEATYYVRIKTQRAYTIPIVVYQNDAFVNKAIQEEWFYGAFIGILLFIAGYNFLLYLTTLERSYIYCSAYVLLSAIILTIYNGYLFQFALPHVSVNPALWQTLITLLQRAFIIIFTLNFLGISRQHGTIYYGFISLLIALGLLTFSVPLLGVEIITPVQLILSLITLGFTTWAGFYYLGNGVKQARFLSIGYLLYSLGVLYNNLLFFKLASPNFFSIHGPEIGIFLESIFLTLALGDKYRADRQAKTKELMATVANLARQNDDLEQFSFVVSHNLRAPVARIMGLINVFELDDKTVIIQHLRKSAQDLDSIIHDLTGIVSIRKGLHQYREKVHLPTLIENELALQADSLRQVEGNSQITHGVDYIMTIPVYLKSVLNNLISNAIKYRNPEKKLQLNIQSGIIGNMVKITVSDNGLGIRPQDQSKIFGLYQRFYDHVEGQGLGLYLVKTQVTAMNGKIEVQSEINLGSTFSILLPLEDTR